MKLLDKKRLIRLYSQTFASELRQNLKSFTNYEVGSPILGKEALEVYSRRFETAGNKFNGFPELLNNLPSHLNEKLKIHSIELKKKIHIIFTDINTKKIYGVLVEK